MDIKGFKAKDGTVHKYDYKELANLPQTPEGEQGANGGYYTPAVTQPAADTLQFDFTPSKADMPSVEPVQVDLPVGQGSGGNVDYVGVEPAEDDIPKVFITGVKPTTKDDVLAEMQYISKTDKFNAYLEIKCQGTSSMSHPKKNFTVKLYADEARETKLKKSFKNWNHESNKFVLKANYIDHAHARNIVSARLWGEVVTSRDDYDSLPVEMRNAPNNGAVDGFPIKVYYNGNYEGVYTWNIGKDAWMWGMDEDNPNHALLCAEGNTDGVYRETPSNFRALWNGVDGAKPGWSVEVGTNSTALKNSLNNLIQFVMDNDGDAFRNGIGDYLDIQSAIDYYIFQYEICGLDGLAHNMLLATFDGKLWRCGAYDLDSTFGLWWNGSSFVSATYACPEDYQERYSLLWERIEANFLPELKARQAELRKTVLSYHNMVTHFERFMDVIGLDLYAEDLTIYTGIPSGSTNNIKQIRNYIRDRQAYVDAEFSAMSEPVPCTGISLNTNTLTFTAEGTQTITATVTPDGCMDSMVWISSNPSVASISVDGAVCTVEAVANGNTIITVTCGDYSASCSVAVSGLVEPVACTGITLNQTELTFDGEGSQTLTATVEPSDTTDTVVWSSDNTTVATVEDGVVTAVSSGSATITATCGGYSATCAVSVTNLGIDYTLNPLENITWMQGSYNTATGEFKDNNDQRTDKFELQNCVYEFVTGTGNTYPSIFMWNENGEYIGGYNNLHEIGKFVAKAGWKYAISVYGSGDAVSLMPVDQSANASGISTVTIDCASETFSTNTQGNAELVITERMVSSGFETPAKQSEIQNKIHKCSHFAFLGSLPGQYFAGTGAEPVVYINAYNGVYYFVVCGISGDDAPTIVGTVTFN